MTTQLTPQNLTVAPGIAPGPQLDFDQIQGDILIGLQKKWQRFLFFTIADIKAFKIVLRNELAHRVTTTRIVHAREFETRDNKTSGKAQILPLIGFNLSFTKSGIGRLVPTADMKDEAFAAGTASRAKGLGDPVDSMGTPTSWDADFLKADIDGVFFITGGSEAEIDAAWQRLQPIIGAAITVVYDRKGNVRSGAAAGHEHFGWQDGISQPAVTGLTTDPFPGQQLVDPGLFVFGYPSQPSPLPLPWMKNGSFMVFRRLQQLVPEFGAFVLSTADSLGVDPVLLGARLVGRWRSGAPLELAPNQDDLNLAKNAQQNNDFDFSDDQAQRRCPFGAHIRKTNPRSDISPIALTPHRIIRQGIPFGPEVSPAEQTANKTEQERGLMFVCYQTSIVNQFEFVQSAWANNPDFVSPIFKKVHPDGSTVTVGFDAIIGQDGTAPRTMDEPVPNYPTGNARSTLQLAQNFIVPKAGAYFFVPSIAALQNELSS